MERIQLDEELSFSRIVQGFWRLADWNKTNKELLYFIEQCMDMGITTFDHADLYGGYTCEELFGKALVLKPELRKNMQIVTKCGIKYVCEKHPEYKIKHYDTSKKHIIHSVESSLRNFNTDYLDVLLIHRPDPFMDPVEVAEAFHQLNKDGKVSNFGVSNFSPSQFNMLSSYLDFPLVTNQVEISPICLNAFEDGTMEHCLEKRISPMAWSPLGGGSIFSSEEEKAVRLRKTFKSIGEELGIHSIDKLIYAWLLIHPAKIIPIVGSGNIDRVKAAVKALEVDLTRQQWFEVLQSSTGKKVK